MLYFKLYPSILLKQSHSFTFLFMYLGELLQYYQSSNKLPHNAQTFDFDLKSCTSCFAQHFQSRCSSRPIFYALCCTTPQVTVYSAYS